MSKTMTAAVAASGMNITLAPPTTPIVMSSSLSSLSSQLGVVVANTTTTATAFLPTTSPIVLSMGVNDGDDNSCHCPPPPHCDCPIFLHCCLPWP